MYKGCGERPPRGNRHFKGSLWGIEWGMAEEKRRGFRQKPKSPCFTWRSQRGSNPRFRRERAVSWATRRWDHLAEEPGFRRATWREPRSLPTYLMSKALSVLGSPLAPFE